MSANRLKLNADKTELLFAMQHKSYSCATLSSRYPVFQLGVDTAVACSHVRLLGVDISSDLSLESGFFYHDVVSRICTVYTDFVNSDVRCEFTDLLLQHFLLVNQGR